MRKRAQTREFHQHQRGLALLLLMLVILAIFGVVLLNNIGSALSGTQRQIQQAQEANDVLMAAKAALLGYVVQTTDGGSVNRLGNLPMPDILNVGPTPPKGTAIQYDGYSDSDPGGANACLKSTNLNGLPGVSPGTTSRQITQRCLGKFPWRTLNLDVGNPSVNDPIGQVPWLAISANLNYADRCLGTLNSETLNWVSAAGTSCPAPASQLPYPWMTVVDQSGNMLSNRVVAVMIMPGSPIQTGNRTQSRSLANPGYASDYLDVISVPLGCSTTCIATFDNAALTNTFIQIPPGTRYPVNAEDTNLAGQAVKFNDVLIYITIDELMSYIERRVLSEMSAAVKDSKSKTNTFPWAAAFSIPADYSAYSSTPGKSFGLFPFFNSGAPNYQSDFDWQVDNVSLPPKCMRIQTLPNRYVDVNENLNADFYSGPNSRGNASGATSTCQWNEIPKSGNAQFSCNYSYASTPPFKKSFSLYSDAACTALAASGSPVTYDVARTSSVVATPICSFSNFTVGYQSADALHPQRITWSCSSVLPAIGSGFVVKATDTITIPVPPSTQIATFTILGVNKSVALKNMRYQPPMPAWFFDNNWYLTAFYAVSPSKAPSPVVPCGATTQLASGNSPADAVVMLAGSRRPVSPLMPTQTRPSAALSDYLEAPNLTAGTTCSFASSSITTTSDANDQVLIVSP